jgi:hypothetical protein
MEGPDVKFERGEATLDAARYEREWGPLLEGRALKSGARVTSVDLRDSPSASTDDEKVAYYRAVARHFDARGWRAQLFLYAKDEPKPPDYPLVLAQSALARRAGVKVLITAPWSDTLGPAADILCPNLTCFFERAGPQTCAHVASVAQLRERLGPGRTIWWYQSCNSHGCTGGPAANPAIENAYRGWASYMVDHPAPLNRAMGVLAFLAGVDGELYFDTVFAFHQQDPWKGVFAFGGNGDGTLFYPGTPEKVGGAHAPVPSLRLKHIRDGLEDYEYLKALTARGKGELARAQAGRLARSGYEITRDLDTWRAVRRAWADELRTPEKER